MALIALVSAKSCGVTTSAAAMALASRRDVLLAELDMSGGSLRHGLLSDVLRHGRPLDGHIGLHKLPQAHWETTESGQFTPAVSDHLWPLDDTDARVALPGLTDPRDAAALSAAWPGLVTVLQLADQQLGWDVVVDGGRLVMEGGRPHPVLTPAPVLYAADLVLLVVRPEEASLSLAIPVAQALQTALAAHGTGGRALGALVVGRDGYPAQEVGRELELPVLGQLPWDERTAAYLSRGGGAPRGLARSPLMRAARDVMGPLREFANKRRLHLQMRQAQATTPAMARLMQQLAQRGGQHG
ncbi:MinD/ParA family ATP-binding protein [Streptomyces sp. WM6378]|uniref:MinD/ParA family ATP-binding protein n=1 Tax=Streptomyces sp. WM6378 TaxID=1415557 RepID=UPI0006AF4125|nr:hypothetical protein [Streptomyces sp. WM6378]KOU37620.1 hypothetical protein ADK54_31375 [Streptomyces sp. WM6378]